MDSHQRRIAAPRGTEVRGSGGGGGGGVGGGGGRTAGFARGGGGVVELGGGAAWEEAAGVGATDHAVHFGFAVARGVKGGGADGVAEDDGEVFFRVDRVLVEMEEDLGASCTGERCC